MGFELFRLVVAWILSIILMLPSTHFILVAENPKLLLDTIRSRCQLLQLHKTSPSQDARLLSQHNLDASAKQQILFLAAGRPLLISQLANNPGKFAEYKDIAVDAKQLLAAKNNYQALKPLGVTSCALASSSGER